MKNVGLFLLAANLIFSLWLYVNHGASPTVAAKKTDSENIDEIITLSEFRTVAAPKPLLTPDSSVVRQAPDKKPVDTVIARDVVAPVENDSTNVAGVEENFQDRVETRVKDIIGFVGEVIDIPAAPEPHCYILGPFAGAADADLAVTRLRRQNIQVSVSETESHKFGGYWVYIPSDSLRSARKQIAQLKELGIQDISLSTPGGVRHLVSLGVYSTRERAQRRQVALSNIGFYTRMEQRVIKSPEYWIDITLEPEQDTALIDSVSAEDWPSMQTAFCREAGNL